MIEPVCFNDTNPSKLVPSFEDCVSKELRGTDVFFMVFWGHVMYYMRTLMHGDRAPSFQPLTDPKILHRNAPRTLITNFTLSSS
mgnify:CR=1 FL=1